MSLRPFAIAFCGLLALCTGCKDTVRDRVARNGEDPALWLQNVLVAEVRLPEKGQAAVWKLSHLVDRAAAVPGVEQASVVDVLPGAKMQWRQVQIEQEGFPQHLRPAGYLRVVSPGHFATMDLRLLHGRFFSKVDNESSPPVAIVNEGYTQQIGSSGGVGGSHENPLNFIGKRVRLGSDAWMTIVGIVQDGPRAQHDLEVYVPYTQLALYGSYGPKYPPDAPPWYLLARFTGDREAVTARLEKGLGLEFRTMEERLSEYMKAHEPK